MSGVTDTVRKLYRERAIVEDCSFQGTLETAVSMCQ